MPTWLLDCFVEMYSKLRAEETMEDITLTQASNNLQMKANDRKQYMRELELRSRRGRMPAAKRVKNLGAMQIPGMAVVREDTSAGGIVLPAGVDA